MRLKLPVIADFSDYERHFNDDVWQQAAAIICARHRISHTTLRRSPQGENIIFFIDDCLVLKIYAPFRGQYRREMEALEFAAIVKISIETPEVVHTGEIEGWPYLVMTRLAGLLMREVWSEVGKNNRHEIVSRLGIALRELHAHAAPLSQTALNRD